jgi:hypothetical protein
MPINYRGYEIDTTPERLLSGRWAARAVVSRAPGPWLQTFPMAAGKLQEFDQAADAAALGRQLAQAWIDRREGLASAAR